MTHEQFLKNLSVPQSGADVVLDTDTYNEIDDQFALTYLLKHSDRLNTVGITAAPFFNERSTGPADGMEKSYNEIHKLLHLIGREDLIGKTFRGSTEYLPDENTPVISDAAKFLADTAKKYSPEHPLYIVAIGAITNVASAFLLNPEMKENTVVVWLGGHGLHYCHTKEFNMKQDIAAARVIMGSGVPFVQLPCMGVVDNFMISKPELEYWLVGKSELATYLSSAVIEAAESYASGLPWTRVIWDVTAVAWLLNDNNSLMQSRIIKCPKPGYDGFYEKEPYAHDMRYVYHINHDGLMDSLIRSVLE